MTQSNTDLFGSPIQPRVASQVTKARRNNVFEELSAPGRYVMQLNGRWGVYEGKMMPVRRLSDTQFSKIYPVLKEVKKGKLVLSILDVRRQHGNSAIKKQYKAHRAIQNKKPIQNANRCQAPEPGIQIQKGRYGSHAAGS